MDAAEILTNISTKSTVPFHSSDQLAAQARKKAEKLEEERAEKAGTDPEPVPDLGPIQQARELRSMTGTPWEFVHQLGRATALSLHGPSLTIAQHWSSVRYVSALQRAKGGRMERSPDGQLTKFHRKGTQAQDLGIGFGLAAVQHVLQRRHEGYRFEPVDAELVLEAGWRLKGNSGTKTALVRQRPGYFMIGRKPGAPLLVAAVECRGTHSTSDYYTTQLARSIPLVNALVLGDSETAGVRPPGFACTTGFAEPGGIETRMLAGGGRGELAIPGKAAPNLDALPEQRNLPPGVPAGTEDSPQLRAGFALPQQDWEWFSQILVRASAASILTFAGDRASAYRLLSTEAQRERLGENNSEFGSGMHCDVGVKLGGTDFVGTDHVFRIKKKRVEAFSGMPRHLYRLLAAAKLEQFETELRSFRQEWRQNGAKAEDEWNGVLHLDDSGTLLAIREQGCGAEIYEWDG